MSEREASGWPRRPPVPADVAVRLLHEGEVEVLGRMPWASNSTMLVDVVDPRHRMLAVYKPMRGERPLWDFDSGTLSRREVAAFEVSDLLGWDLIPATVWRDGPAGEGSLQRFVDHDPEDHYFTLLEEGGHEEVLRRFAAFDVVANNTDRKAGHIIRDTDGHVWGIDHGVCFHVQWKLRTVVWDFGGERLSDSMRADLEAFLARLEGDGCARLRPLLSVFEIDAVRARTAGLLTKGRFPTVDPGYHSYPWPLV
jgi:uncharacterized repeat protein (TIGR03843 family)